MSHSKQFIEAGVPLPKASKALIMIHGRGASAKDILSLRSEFSLDEFYIVAPQATNFSWYPYSFLAPVQQNEPWLTSAIHLITDLVGEIQKAGIHSDKVWLLGFSQGACLTLEFASRNARKWGGIIAFTGGLIGEKVNPENYSGNFESTKVFIGNSDSDPHVPMLRSQESAKIMENLGADVKLKIYPRLPHMINQDEIETVNEMFLRGA